MARVVAGAGGHQLALGLFALYTPVIDPLRADAGQYYVVLQAEARYSVPLRPALYLCAVYTLVGVGPPLVRPRAAQSGRLRVP